MCRRIWPGRWSMRWPGLSSMSGPALQRRARTMLMSLCPDLLRERIRKGRKRVGLRRWMGEQGTDSWGGSFPSERAARAWAAIDALARRYRLEGRHDTLEQARAYALMDLVDGNATVETVLHLSVPVEGLDAATRAARAPGGVEDPDAEVEAEAEGEARRRADDRECMEDCAGGGGRCVVSAHGRAGVGDHGDVAGASGGASLFRPRLSKTVGMDTSGDAVFVGVAGAQGRSISWLPVSALMSCTRDAGSAAVVCHGGPVRCSTPQTDSRRRPTGPGRPSRPTFGGEMVGVASRAARSRPGSATWTMSSRGRTARPRPRS